MIVNTDMFGLVTKVEFNFPHLQELYRILVFYHE